MDSLDRLNYNEIGANLLHDMFRILHLDRAVNVEPGTGDDAIECNLATSSLGENPSYIALSYCWDVPQPQIPIICNGKKILIRYNLHSALRCMRLPGEPRAVWADAVCINQENLEERARQVGLMKDIFQTADEVVVWLGEEADDSAVGMQAAQDLADAGREYLKQRSTLENLSHDDPLVAATFYGFKRRSEYPRFNALSKIIDRNWFSRTWVIQEVAVAAKITVYCGAASMSWEDFMNAATLQNQLDLYTTEHDRNTPPLILKNTRINHEAGVYQDLLTVMYRHRLFDATDPRDKIYGLGGLAGDPLAKKFMATVDYTLDKFDLYRQVATGMLKEHSDLNVLSIPPGLEREHASGLPSWAPDWRTTRQTPCVGLVNADDIYKIRYKASGDSKKTVQFDETGLILGLECCWVDTIEAVGNVMVVDDLPQGYAGVLRIAKVSYMLDEWRIVTRALEGVNYPTSEPVLDAFIQTLVGGPPHLEMEFMREQYSILDRQARLLRWMRRLRRAFPARAETTLVRLLQKLFKVPKSNIAFAFGVSSCPLADRTVFRTKKGYIGLGSIRAGPGDLIAIPKGGKVPLVLRPYGSKWQMRGDCYVHGVMYGEAFSENEAETVWIV